MNIEVYVCSTSETHQQKYLDEGDIKVNGNATANNDISQDKRNAIRNREYLWRSKMVPYELENTYGNRYN